MKMSQWPKQEQPRQKLLLRGANALSDAELLAVVIQTGCKGKSAVDLARIAIQQMGTLRAVMQAPKQNVLKLEGFGEARYATLLAMNEMHKRVLTQEMQRGESFTCVNQVSRLMSAHLKGKSIEVFCVVMLDSQHQLIAIREMFSGTINSAPVYPREIVKQVLEDNAAVVILAHNHPSGCAEPSQADIAITKRVIKALSLIDVNVLDHFVIGDKSAVSFAQRGLL